jgi:hypothetical protein
MALPQKSRFRLGGGQYRNAVASGRFRTYVIHSKIERLYVTRRYRVTVLTSSNNDSRLLRQSRPAYEN